MSRLLDNKVAIVTGAGRGIGREHALELARQGAQVVVNDLGTSARGEGQRRSPADEVVAAIHKEGGSAVADYGDVGDELQANSLVGRALDSFGSVDILVNNAGIIYPGDICLTEVHDFDRVSRVHVRGTWLMSRAVARHWSACPPAGAGTNRRIINTTSGIGLRGQAGQSAYASAKAAVAGLTLALSLELEYLGVTVNAIAPWGLTRMSATAVQSGGEETVPEIGPGDLHYPGSSSPLVAWLASDSSHWISGQVFRVIGQTIQLLGGWREIASAVSAAGQWNASTIGKVVESDLFNSRVPGVQVIQ